MADLADLSDDSAGSDDEQRQQQGDIVDGDDLLVSTVFAVVILLVPASLRFKSDDEQRQESVDIVDGQDLLVSGIGICTPWKYLLSPCPRDVAKRSPCVHWGGLALRTQAHCDGADPVFLI